MKLNAFIEHNTVVPQLQATQRDPVIEEMIDVLVAAEAVPPERRDELVRMIIEREEHGSTGFGKGVAVPHVKHPDVTRMVGAIGVSSHGIDFNALDKAPVYSVVLLISPEDQPDEHLQAMENVFRSLQIDTFRRFLRQSSSVQEIMDLIQEADAHQLQG